MLFQVNPHDSLTLTDNDLPIVQMYPNNEIESDHFELVPINPEQRTEPIKTPPIGVCSTLIVTKLTKINEIFTTKNEFRLF